MFDLASVLDFSQKKGHIILCPFAIKAFECGINALMKKKKKLSLYSK